MIKIKNWSSYQSYKDRRPTWIRLHKSLLDDYEFQMMSTNSRAILPMLWLLASENEDPKSGIINKSVQEIAFRLRLTVKIIKSCIDELEKNNFLQVVENKECNGVVTEALQNAPDFVTTEKRREEAYKEETETEESKNGASPAKPNVAKLSDSEWIETLKENPAYKGVDIETLQGKMIAWCELRKVQPTRKRLLNWLNREDRKMEPVKKERKFIHGT